MVEAQASFKAKLWMVDDDPEWMELYREKLVEAGYGFDAYVTVEEVDQHFQAGDRPDLIILDMILAWGTLFSEEDTNGGKRTGLRVFERIRDKYDFKGPVIVLTSVHDDDLKKYFEGNGCVYCEKIETPPAKLVKVVRGVVGVQRA